MKTAKELKLTKSQHKNLAKLTIFVRDKVAPPKFDMRRFFQTKTDDGHCCDDVCPIKEEYVCGSSACFLGYAILAGIKAQKGETWNKFCKRAFGIEMSWDGDSNYQLLFCERHKNNKAAAVKRGAYLLMNGIPECKDLEKWETPRSFKVDWKAIEALANS